MLIKYRKRAGHRSWAAKNAPVPGKHRGDIMSPVKRSALMSKIKCKNTVPEIIINEALKRAKIQFKCHPKGLPGRPDFILYKYKIAIFVDGDFWHGWRFPLWKHKLSKKWQDKIACTRKRDKRNFDKLRRQGIKVIRIWEHQIEQVPDKCIMRILMAIKNSTAIV